MRQQNRSIRKAVMHLSSGVVVMGSLALPSLASAAIVSVQYLPGTKVAGPAGVVPADNYNIDSTSITYFDPETTGIGPLQDSDGNTTTIAETKTDYGHYHAGGSTNFSNAQDNNLYSGGVLSDEGVGAVNMISLTGLDPTASYNLFVYLRDANGSSQSSVTNGYLSDNSQSYYLTLPSNANMTGYIQGSSTLVSSPTTGGNYFEFAGLTGSGTVQVDITNSNYYDLVGFQLVSSVPEPASLSLLGLGAIALLGRRRTAKRRIDNQHTPTAT